MAVRNGFSPDRTSLPLPECSELGCGHGSARAVDGAGADVGSGDCSGGSGDPGVVLALASGARAGGFAGHESHQLVAGHSAAILVGARVMKPALRFSRLALLAASHGVND